MTTDRDETVPPVGPPAHAVRVIGKGEVSMRGTFARGVAAVAASGAFSVAGVIGTGVPGTAASTGQAASASAAKTSHGLAVPGTQLWLRHYRGPGKSDDAASSVAVSPRGGMVFVTGTSERASAGFGPGDTATAAYSATTGAQLWVKRYNGPGNSFDRATSVAVSPGGGRVFVTGASNSTQGGPSDYITIAYKVATGARLWVKRYSGPGFSDDGATSLAVSPDGRTVFVTGSSGGPTANSNEAFATIAYSAATGAWQWGKRYGGPGNRGAGAASVAVNPAGGSVFVTGTSGNDYATVAYSTQTGARLWVASYPGPSDPRDDGGATSVAVSQGGNTLFVTGTSFGPPGSSTDYGTVAYNAVTGAQLWAEHYNGPSNGGDRAASVAVSSGGSRVFVTGASDGDYGTVAYNAFSGAQVWARRYNDPGNRDDFATALAVGPHGQVVFVTGFSGGAAATVAYAAKRGAQLWVRRYHGPGNRGAGGTSVAVGPRRAEVFVTGSSRGATTGSDYATIAYRR
jgi:DNA-binding beta-propeller fold protein YncE